MVTAVDTNILLDIGFGAPSDERLAREALLTAERQGIVITSAVCYAEIAGKYLRAQDCANFLAALSVTVSPIDEETAFLAGQFMREYKLRGGTRTRILADFLIAAHAQLHSGRLLTRDSRFFTEAFPQLKAVAPNDL